ncbi:MauE/DoxX family redox-associated membrane protein [Terrabacter sp. NPDC080008]|uniref:DoxX family protein n=1 Tax=Terrabacter sp. NPDC080008 TaxID=3155176 RepID=UPI00344E9986
MRTGPKAPLRKDAAALAGLFALSGTLHFVRPQVFEAIVPKQLPAHRALVYASGAAELACAAGLLAPPTRRAAGIASAAVLVAVFPANVSMATGARRRLARRPGDPRRRAYLAATLLRLPLQWPMIRMALRAAGVSGRS